MFYKDIERRVIFASETALSAHKYVSIINVFINMGWLEPRHVIRWRNGQIPYLERSISTNLKKISFVAGVFRKWAAGRGLKPSETVYLLKTKGPKRELQFSKSGYPGIERAYRTHYISPGLSERRQRNLKEKLSREPELVVYIIFRESQCSLCGAGLPKHSFLYLEAGDPLCLKCAGMDNLVFLPSGDAKITRHARKYSGRSAVVVQFSHSRKRYERQGLLVEAEAVKKAEEESSSGCE